MMRNQAKKKLKYSPFNDGVLPNSQALISSKLPEVVERKEDGHVVHRFEL